jgi:hypothetical protein
MKTLLHLSSPAERSEGKGIQTSCLSAVACRSLDPLPSAFGLAGGDELQQRQGAFAC